MSYSKPVCSCVFVTVLRIFSIIAESPESFESTSSSKGFCPSNWADFHHCSRSTIDVSGSRVLLGGLQRAQESHRFSLDRRQTTT